MHLKLLALFSIAIVVCVRATPQTDNGADLVPPGPNPFTYPSCVEDAHCKEKNPEQICCYHRAVRS